MIISDRIVSLSAFVTKKALFMPDSNKTGLVHSVETLFAHTYHHGVKLLLVGSLGIRDVLPLEWIHLSMTCNDCYTLVTGAVESIQERR